jgi:N6-adenosine-specific RNA methylase IME4
MASLDLECEHLMPKFLCRMCPEEHRYFNGLQSGHYRAVLIDPPWHFEVWALDKTGKSRHASLHYDTMPIEQIYDLPVQELAAPDCVLFLWVTWPMLEHGLQAIARWKFKYKTCAFAWMKANGSQINLFDDEITADMLTGYWTRANSEVCLLATRGSPKRLNADVRQGIIAPRREHSRKPDGIHDRIERLVAGPYCELFARQRRTRWDSWGNDVDKFAAQV